MTKDYPTPAAPPPAEALAARPLVEQVAKLGNRIDADTVGEIKTISSRAAAWLEENPPGQPAAIKPRNCPTPVVFCNGLWVAVVETGTGNRVTMTSTNCVNWTISQKD